jgi:hypothetical protein
MLLGVFAAAPVHAGKYAIAPTHESLQKIVRGAYRGLDQATRDFTPQMQARARALRPDAASDRLTLRAGSTERGSWWGVGEGFGSQDASLTIRYAGESVDTVAGWRNSSGAPKHSMTFDLATPGSATYGTERLVTRKRAMKDGRYAGYQYSRPHLHDQWLFRTETVGRAEDGLAGRILVEKVAVTTDLDGDSQEIRYVVREQGRPGGAVVHGRAYSLDPAIVTAAVPFIAHRLIGGATSGDYRVEYDRMLMRLRQAALTQASNDPEHPLRRFAQVLAVSP